MPLYRGTRYALLAGSGAFDAVAALLSLSPVALWIARLGDIFAEEDGTGAVAPTGAVGYWADISGNAHHIVQATAANRPTFQTSAGIRWIEADGSDDLLSTGATDNIAQPYDRIGAYHVLGDDTSGHVWEGGSGALWLDGANFQHFSGSQVEAIAAPTGGTDFVLTERINGASSMFAIDDGAFGAALNVGAGAIGTIGLFNGSSGAGALNMRCYAAGIFPTLTAGQLGLARKAMAARQGRVL
jgi:hypothetical protein